LAHTPNITPKCRRKPDIDGNSTYVPFRLSDSRALTY